MSYTYFNQRNFPNTPYPHATRPGATIKSSGCGVCCAAMAIANVTSFPVSVEEMAQYSIAKGGRDGSGTNLKVLLAAIKKDYAGFDYRFTNDLNEMIGHLQAGGAAIANVGGDRGNHKGIFCDSGHFVFVVGVHTDGRLIILDPDNYSGKYTINGRGKYVTVNGDELYCAPADLDRDCNNKDPRYYLVAGIKDKEPAPQPDQAATKYTVGEHVTFSTCYTSSDAPTESNIPASKMARNHGVITRIIQGARNPYLLDDSLCWVNDGDIRGYYSGTRTGTVATNSMNLNLRKAPDGEIITSMPKGAQVEIIGEQGGWYQVRVNGLTGWCSGEYIK